MLGIIIVNYNAWETTKKCINNIFNKCKIPVKVYVVDNNSTNDSFVKLSDLYKDEKKVKVIKSEINGGYAKGNNIGINACRKDSCDYAIISNNDIEFYEEGIEELFNFIQERKEVAIAGPKIFKVEGDIQHSTILKKHNVVEEVGLAAKIRKILKNKKKEIDELLIESPVRVYSISGCCFIANLNILKDIGAFDEGTFLYNEENILCSQIEKNNYEVWFVPSARVIHENSGTIGQESLFMHKEILKSSLYYWRKYENTSVCTLIFIYLFSILKTFIKMINRPNLRKGIKIYLKETCKALWSEIKRKKINL